MAPAMLDFPREIHTRLNYYLEPQDGGTTITYPGTAGDKLRKHQAADGIITDIRSCNESFTLDKNGFQLASHSSTEKTFDNDERVKSSYYDEIAEHLKNVTGATHVVPFSHIIRREAYEEMVDAAKRAEGPKQNLKAGPAMFAHVDQSYAGAEQVLKDNTPDAERLAKSRWAIINVWRPIERPVLREPLAVCDARSVDESDLRAVKAILPQKGTGQYSEGSKGEGFELWNLAKSDKYRWYYASKMTPDETLLIKCFDSKKDGRARLSPHTAFQSEFDQGPPRQSIEVRTLVFWEDQSCE